MGFWQRHGPLIMHVLKWVIFFITLGYIYQVVFISEDFREMASYLGKITGWTYAWFVLAFALMIVNWGLESAKWHFLIRRIQPTSYPTAFKAVLSGVTVSNFLPNRLGEYLGRIFYVAPKRRIKAILANLIGSFAQLLATTIAGTIAFLVYFYLSDFDVYLYYFVAMVGIGAIGLLLLVYYNIGLVNDLLPNSRKMARIRQYINVFSYYHSSGLSRLLFLAFLRYAVFMNQYGILLKAFGVGIEWQHLLLTLPLVFFVQSVVPTIAATELGVRGATGVYFIGQYASNKAGILMSAYSLWVLNLIIPAIFGAIFLILQKKNLSQE